MILYVFISCQSKLDQCKNKITSMMNNLNCNDYVIVIGGNTENTYDKNTHILKLNCNDFYEGLPEKVIKTFKYISENTNFNKYKYICKMDQDTQVRKLLTENMLTDYCGFVNRSGKGNRKWHIGKCSKNNKFNIMKYMGHFPHWCMGGFSYVLSKKAINLIKDDEKYLDEIYEDVYIGKLLEKIDIKPSHIRKLKQYIRSPDHVY